MAALTRLALPAIRPEVRARAIPLAALCLLALLVVQATSSMAQKSVTVDEITYITAGYYHLQTGDFHYNETNPPLMKMLAAFPLLFLGVELPEVQGTPDDWNQVEQWRYAREFLYANRVDADRMLFVARLPIVALATLLGWFVFRFTRELAGDGGALAALALYCTSPNLLAHARLATQDLGLTAVMFFATLAFWRALQRPGPSRTVLCGCFLGLGLLVKTPALLLVGSFALYTTLCIVRGNGLGIDPRLPGMSRLPPERVRARQLLSSLWLFAGIGVAALGVVNVAYGFQGSLAPLGAVERVRDAVEQRSAENPALQPVADIALKLPVPLPSAYLEGLLFQLTLGGRPSRVFLAGEIHSPAPWYLTLVSMLLKTPLPLIALMLGGVAWALARWRHVECERLLLCTVFVLLAAFSVMSGIGGAVRYVLPVYPALFVLAGGLVPLASRHRFAPALLVGCFAWLLWSSASIYPHYLAYFNEIAGGPERGYRMLSDSNLDWGQDLKGLRAYMDERGIDRIKLGYFGSADARYYGIEYDYLPSVGLAPLNPGEYWWYEEGFDEARVVGPQRGLIAVSASLLAGAQWVGPRFENAYDWLEGHEPVDQVGHSILIFEIE